MMTLLKTILVTAVFSIGPTAQAAMSAVQVEAAAAAGKQALSNYVTYVINDENVRNFGFESLAEARSARLGAPFAPMIMDLSAITAHDPRSALRPSLRDDSRLWYPVLAADKVRTGLEMVLQKGQWVAGALGGTVEIRILSTVKDELPRQLEKSRVKSPYTVSVVQMPSLFATFFYVTSQGSEFLVPAMSQPQRYDLENATVYPARQVMESVKKHAAEIKPGLIR